MTLFGKFDNIFEIWLHFTSCQNFQKFSLKPPNMQENSKKFPTKKVKNKEQKEDKAEKRNGVREWEREIIKDLNITPQGTHILIFMHEVTSHLSRLDSTRLFFCLKSTMNIFLFICELIWATPTHSCTFIHHIFSFLLKCEFFYVAAANLPHTLHYGW